ncbi:NAD+ synthase [Rhodoluna sp.]|uniref:NAD+ synthase n=1 Tax=Rhodoluna sp. TaxID=1969481 RepID=UPI0025CEEF2E|nr:NAD+ synthase [Rhodoluna sp.]
MPKVRLAMAQTNPTVGDIHNNIANCLQVVKAAAANGAQLVVFPEMSATGYPIEDLASRRSFIESSEAAIETFASQLSIDGYGEIAVVIGHPRLARNSRWAIAHNSASVIRDGKIIGTYDKHHLPNYSVFDEYRVFVPGDSLLTFEHAGLRFSTLICEDIWQSGGPVAQLSTNATDVTLVLNGSPFEVHKDDRRLELVQNLAGSSKSAVAYVNLVGGQDDLVFDGDSLFVTSAGNLITRAAKFEESLTFIDVDSSERANEVNAAPINSELESSDEGQVWTALVLGLRDYVRKNGFKSVVLGLSGGIDSAVCAVIAADAIGADNVFGVSMPSMYSSDHSKSDAEDLAERLGCHYRTETIETMVEAFEGQLNLEGLASENLQARMRGVILMALSNAEGHLTLTTGNKTELAVGYSTIYGDSVGGFAPIKDVEKTRVWRLAEWRNSFAAANGQTPPIPSNSISKPPSAELRPGQVDQDSLPDYAILDGLLELYVEQGDGRDEIIRAGFDEDTVDRIIGLVDRAEWKRRQGAIGPKISPMAFGRDRRLPITNRFKEGTK